MKYKKLFSLILIFSFLIPLINPFVPLISFGAEGGGSDFIFQEITSVPAELKAEGSKHTFQTEIIKMPNNDNEFLVIRGNYGSLLLYKYNIISNKWTKIGSKGGFDSNFDVKAHFLNNDEVIFSTQRRINILNIKDFSSKLTPNAYGTEYNTDCAVAPLNNSDIVLFGASKYQTKSDSNIYVYNTTSERWREYKDTILGRNGSAVFNKDRNEIYFGPGYHRISVGRNWAIRFNHSLNIIDPYTMEIKRSINIPRHPDGDYNWTNYDIPYAQWGKFDIFDDNTLLFEGTGDTKEVRHCCFSLVDINTGRITHIRTGDYPTVFPADRYTTSSALAANKKGEALITFRQSFRNRYNSDEDFFNRFFILKKNNPPTLSITAPANNSLIHKGANTNIKWTANDPDVGDVLSYNVKIGNTPGGTDYFDGNANGSCNNIGGNHVFDTSQVPLAWNDITGRYEKTVYTRVTVTDAGGKQDTKDISFTIYNHKPGIEVTTESIKTNISGDFSLKGIVWDGDSDDLIVSAIIDGKTKTATIKKAPSSRGEDNFTLVWDNIKEGEYKDIIVTVKDNWGGENQYIWRGTLSIRNVLKDINEKIGKHVLPSDQDLLFISSNTEHDIKETASNNTYIDHIKSKMANRNAQDMFFVGLDGKTKQYIQENLTKEYAIKSEGNHNSLVDYVLRIVGQSVDTRDYVIDKVGANGKKIDDGENINHNMLFSDEEKDYEGISIEDKLNFKNPNINNLDLEKLEKLKETMKPKEGTLQVMYEHDPTVFDNNPIEKHSRADEQWHVISDIDDPFVLNKAERSMIGEWKITLKASDNTKNPIWDKYSDDKTEIFYIHRLPEAIIEYYDDGDKMFLIGEKSYDEDLQYRLPNNGIVKYEWFYRLQDDGNWHKWPEEIKNIHIPKIIDGKVVSDYALRVYDYHGRTHTTEKKTEFAATLSSRLSAQEEEKFPDIQWNQTGIPSSEYIKLTDIVTRPRATDSIKIEFFNNKAGTSVGGRTITRTLTNPQDLTDTSDLTTKRWRDVTNIQIPPNTNYPDGEYTVVATTTDKKGAILKNTHQLKINTPINLKLTEETKKKVELEALTKATFSTTTSKYVKEVKFIPYQGAAEVSMNCINIDENNGKHGLKKWEYTFTVPDKPEGTYTATFTAITGNGKRESITHNYLIYSLKLINFRITNIVNHKNYSYPISKENLPVLYKTGYNVTFRINSKGYPNSVKTVITTSPSVYNNTITLKKVGTSGNQEIWEGKFFVPVNAGGKLDNIKIYANTTAYKGSTTYNYNAKENWNGHILTISGRALQDVRINRTK